MQIYSTGERGVRGKGNGEGGVGGGRARRWPDNFDRIAKETYAVLLDAMPDFLEVASSNTFHSYCLAIICI
jgi:hypothetical protein